MDVLKFVGAAGVPLWYGDTMGLFAPCPKNTTGTKLEAQCNMRKRYLSIVVVPAIVGIVIWSLIPGDRVTPKNFGRVQPGMTEAAVEQILGRRADHEYHPWDISVFLKPAPGTKPEWEKIWKGPHGTIFIHFDAQGKVCNKAFQPPDVKFE
jgi:hypothetical protein